MPGARGAGTGDRSGKLTAAWLLDRVFGQLRHLKCEDCDASPQLKRERGCGRPPIRDGVQWDARGFADWHRRRGLTGEDVSSLAVVEYEHADEGSVCTRTGRLWPWCPAWFSRKAVGAPTGVAQRVMRLTRARMGEDPGLPRETALTAAGVDLVEMACRLWHGLREDEREMDKARKGQGGTSWDSAAPRRR